MTPLVWRLTLIRHLHHRGEKLSKRPGTVGDPKCSVIGLTDEL